MDQMGYDRGLVKYTTDNLLAKTGDGKYHLLRPRLIGYTVVLSLMVGILLFTLISRVPLSVEALRDRGQLYRENNEGWIENSYTLKIQNKAQTAADYEIRASSDAFPIHLDGEPLIIRLQAGELATRPVSITANPDEITARRVKIEIEVTQRGDTDVRAKTENTFLSPRL